MITTNIPNVIDTGMTLGKKVCIVAPGPNGVNHYDEIPDDFSIIAVNKAILIDELTPSWWVIAHTDNSWFNTPDKTYSGVRVYNQSIVSHISETARMVSGDKVYYFPVDEKESLQEEVVLPVEGKIRTGATVAALAIQLAYNIGAREILLCGVDMSGNGYWDKSENENPNVLNLHGDTWCAVSRLNPLLDYMKNELNVTISTLSPSKLNVPFYTKKNDE
ncbi:MAG: hypothetical protein HRT58_00945 [Crocinitomicaceae bacterium]|nr:hypothetical protein [Flavobacteriales bacterium]NQZ34189.1 hypothetical protein [Crocinitomicaceae bacterium]